MLNNALKNSINYIIARNGRITSYEDVTAVVVRDESLVDISMFSGDMQVVAQDGTRVANGDTLVSFVKNSNPDYDKRINEIDTNLQELIEQSQIEYTQDLNTVDKTIGAQIYNLLDKKNSIYDINIYKKSIYSNMEKKIELVGSAFPKDSEINALIKERKELEKSKEQDKEELKAKKAGLVSYRIDGYENTFKPQAFRELSVNKIRNIKYNPDQQIPTSIDNLKIINNFYNYLVLITKSKEAKELSLNDEIKVSIDDNLLDYEKAVVEYIIEDQDERLLVLRVKNNIEKLSQYRVIKAYIIWWNYEGIKVQDEAIYETDIKDETGTKTYAHVNALKVLGTTGYQKEVWVKINESAEGYSIVSNYDDEELKELGIPENLIDNRNTLNLYDRIVIND